MLPCYQGCCWPITTALTVAATATPTALLATTHSCHKNGEGHAYFFTQVLRFKIVCFLTIYKAKNVHASHHYYYKLVEG